MLGQEAGQVCFKVEGKSKDLCNLLKATKKSTKKRLAQNTHAVNEPIISFYANKN